MGITREIGFDASSKIAFGGLALAGAVDRMAASAQARRAHAVDSVSELALRLQEARRDQGAAERRAAAAEARAARRCRSSSCACRARFPRSERSPTISGRLLGV